MGRSIVIEIAVKQALIYAPQKSDTNVVTPTR